MDDTNLRRVARHLGVLHQSVANWVKTHAEQIPPAPMPATVDVAEMDELFTFIGCTVVWERTSLALPRVVEQGPRARTYFGDALPTYATLGYYLATYTVSAGKHDTYSVEGNNAELRHYLARLARRSRCFSGCPMALCHALRLFFYAFNARQLHKATFPQYSAHVFEFLAPLH